VVAAWGLDRASRRSDLLGLGHALIES
jgi:hypothetical protein